ncbi:unnamed protein product [Adineta steineri]|uniref:G-protein coupled receptors family 1 profile domain-containing protein n=1 Tax=Adineta steineri TaxID=433720 RepID=A0A813MHX6_9BILA|nr:unnamed protein product [Adineta steineri]CAF0735457.1 unnamed protein product [Adineta steineri]CAF1498518.1 unnamed protein product [Adineta steineri]CAF3664753.1 unnamed protein product [Adineta steineri]CAF4092160.1 unnamed protein product [Adineta steineri]
MSSSDNSSDNNSDLFIDLEEVSIPRSIRFWIMLLFNIPSIICSFCIIIHIIHNRAQRYALHNHAIFLVLIMALPIQLIDINFFLVFYRYGSIQPSEPIMCLLWWLADYGCYSGCTILIAWLAIERYILIFHDRWVSNRRGRFLFHYLPSISLVAYIVVFYIISILFPPCENNYIYTLPGCGAAPCFQSYGFLAIWDGFVNNTTPIILESIVNIGLILRVQWQKRRLRQSNQWRKQRRMIIQLCMISGLNMCLNIPLTILLLAHFFGLAPEYGAQPQLYFSFLGYFVFFLFPFTSLCQFPDLRKNITRKIVGILPRQQQHHTATVIPMNTLT